MELLILTVVLSTIGYMYGWHLGRKRTKKRIFELVLGMDSQVTNTSNPNIQILATKINDAMRKKLLEVMDDYL